MTTFRQLLPWFYTDFTIMFVAPEGIYEYRSTTMAQMDADGLLDREVLGIAPTGGEKNVLEVLIR